MFSGAQRTATNHVACRYLVLEEEQPEDYAEKSKAMFLRTD